MIENVYSTTFFSSVVQGASIFLGGIGCLRFVLVVLKQTLLRPMQ